MRWMGVNAIGGDLGFGAKSPPSDWWKPLTLLWLRNLVSVETNTGALHMRGPVTIKPIALANIRSTRMAMAPWDVRPIEVFLRGWAGGQRVQDSALM